jgi:Cys-tRNA synthase (O-phospho-L-seryl-tRNA:Cys-tRNA synthase)
MVLPQTGEGAYSNGRYAISGTNAQADWIVGRGAPVSCRGN